MVTKKDGISLLQGVPLFTGLSQRDLGRIWDRMKIVEHRDGHQIITEGRNGQGFHLIIGGEVKVERTNLRVTLGKGDFFGEMSLIDDGPRSATVTAVGPVTTAAISAWEFKALVANQPELMWKLLVFMTGRLRQQQSVAADLIA
jgi:CRP/FNR family cyclic AMP-dependent transcriptional regulator